MGLYDTIDVIPNLPNGEKGSLQTKNLTCDMSNYLLDENWVLKSPVQVHGVAVFEIYPYTGWIKAISQDEKGFHHYKMEFSNGFMVSCTECSQDYDPDR